MKGNKDDYSDSDEDQHDAYLERMKAEGKIREEANDSEESDGESGELPVVGQSQNCIFFLSDRGRATSLMLPFDFS